jgi:hypothetical protein
MATDGNISGLFNLKASFPTEDERRAFFRAARENETGVLEKLLRKFPDAAQAWRNDSGEGVIPAHGTDLAPKTLALLMKHGANIDDTGTPENQCWPALKNAAYNGNIAAVEMLLRAGAKVDIQDRYGDTPLMQAVDEEKFACVDLLVLAGADPGFVGARYRKSALDRCKSDAMRDVITAAQKRRADFLAGTPQAAKPAFAPNAPPERRDLDDIMPLRTPFPTDEEKEAFFTAARENDLRALRRVFDKFPEAAVKWRHRYGEAVVARAGREVKPATLELLLAHGANIDDNGTPESRETSPLHAAAENGEVERMALLLRFGAKIDVPDSYGRTPLARAIDEGKPACVDLLVLAGANPDLTPPNARKSPRERCETDEMREIVKTAQEKRANFLKGLPPEEQPRFVPPRPPAAEISTVKILKRIDLRFKI